RRGQLHRHRRRARSDHRTAGRRCDLHDSEEARPAALPRHRNLQRPKGRRIFLHAEPQRPEVARKSRAVKRRRPHMQYQTINPFTEELVQTFPLHTDDEAEALIGNAEKTYATDWGRRPLAARRAVVKNAASILRDKADEFSGFSTMEMGKLFREGKA